MSGNQNEEELIANFSAVAGVDAERARFYLEASGWQLQTALSGFYEGEQDEDQEGMDGINEISAGNPAALEPEAINIAETGTTNSQTQAPRAPAGARGGLATIDSVRGNDDKNDEKGQAFYAGGSQSSGQQVLGPPPKKRSEIIAEMFQKAREHGAEEVNVSQGILRKPGAKTFSGTGHRLGESSGAGAEVVQPESASDPESRHVVLRLWSTGFTVNDGALREYHDPANAEFLRSVKQGEIPKELIRDNMGFEVEVTMEDRHHEDYAPPKAAAKPFFGKGNVLGSPAPVTVGSVGPVNTDDQKANENAAREQLGFKESEPSTNIQFRLVDGTRLVVRVNHSHTVNDLHNFINIARPQFSSSNYVLTLFPNTELTEKGVTVKEANLLNSALTQKLK